MRISGVCWRYCGGAGASISEGSRRAAQKRIQKCYLIESSTCHVYTGFSVAVFQHTAHSVRAQEAASSYAIFDQSANIVKATQRFTILQVSSGSMRLLISLEGFTILHTEFGRRRLLLPLQLLTSQQTAYAMFAKNLDRGIIFEQNC